MALQAQRFYSAFNMTQQAQKFYSAFNMAQQAQRFSSSTLKLTYPINMNATAQRLSVESSWLRILIFISYHHRTYYSFQSKEREIGSKQGSDTS